MFRAVGVAQSDKTGCYVVVLKNDSNGSTFDAVKSVLLDLSKDSRLYASVEKITKAITVAVNDSSLNIVSSVEAALIGNCVINQVMTSLDTAHSSCGVC